MIMMMMMMMTTTTTTTTMMMMMTTTTMMMTMMTALGDTAEPTVPGSEAVVRTQDVWRGGSAEKDS